MPARDRARLKKALAGLADDPLTARSGADIKKLKGAFGREDLYRLRVGAWRAFYAIRDEVVVIDIRKRESAY